MYRFLKLNFSDEKLESIFTRIKNAEEEIYQAYQELREIPEMNIAFESDNPKQKED